MRYLYSLVFYLALPGIFLRLWWKGRKSPGYRLRWRERLGYISPITTAHSIWLHAVSLGEVLAARPLILALQATYPHNTLIITTATVTGSTAANQFVGDNTRHVYAPYDIPSAVQRFLRRVRPQQVIIIETELWPNLLHYTARRRIPILLANARLSQRSMQNYQRVVSLTRKMLVNIQCIAAQTQQDAKHFTALGATAAQIRIVGNIKFDVPVPTALVTQGQQLRRSWGELRPTLVAASTHAGEEELILQAFSKVLIHYPTALLIVVPRHPERFADVAKLCQRQDYKSVRRSQQPLCTADTQVLIGDSMGELFLYYALADIAFVGGSLVDNIGGHNVLEPAALALPMMTGPYTFNFTEIVHLLRNVNGISVVNTADELAATWVEFLANPAHCAQLGQYAKKVVEQNSGALARHLELIAQCMGATKNNV